MCSFSKGSNIKKSVWLTVSVISCHLYVSVAHLKLLKLCISLPSVLTNSKVYLIVVVSLLYSFCVFFFFFVVVSFVNMIYQLFVCELSQIWVLSLCLTLSPRPQMILSLWVSWAKGSNQVFFAHWFTCLKKSLFKNYCEENDKITL